MKFGNLLLMLTCMLTLSINASSQVFRYVVATDGSGDYTSVQSALNACPDNARSIIFIKNGTYNEQVTLGASTSTSTKLISLIGESYGGVIITHNQYRASSGSPTYADVCTVKLYANDFYAENITIQNTATAGMAEALYTSGDRLTFRNCRLLGYQDTFRTKKGVRCYFKNCWIEGAVDFIYAGGTIFFDDCTLNCVKGGGSITAPEDRYKYIPASSTTSGHDLNLEFIFRNCNITANSDVADNSFTLGRPWNINSGTYYLNCTLGSHIKAAGWATMSGNETTASFGEYNSLDKNGIPVSTSGRVSWSFQLAKTDVDNLLTPSYVYAQITSTTVYDPVSLCVSPTKPSIEITNNTISWNALNDATGYIVYRDGKYIGSTTATSFTDTSGTGAYSVRAINSIGVLSDIATIATALSEVQMGNIGITVNNKTITLGHRVEKMQLISTTGAIIAQNTNESMLALNNLSQGVYLLKIYDKGLVFTKKLILGIE